MAEAQFNCGTAIKLPSDAELSKWDANTVFTWSEGVLKWGNYCAELLSYNEHFIKCWDGNKMECTYVNQLPLPRRPVIVAPVAPKAGAAPTPEPTKPK